MPIISTNQKLAQATPLIDLHGSGQILFFLTAYINTSQLISNTTIPNENMFHSPRKPKPRKPRTALVLFFDVSQEKSQKKSKKKKKKKKTSCHI